MIKIRDVKFNNFQFFNLEDVDLNHFLREKVEQIIEIINIQLLIFSSLITAVNNEIDESSYSLKDFKFSTLLNSALTSFIDLNSILNQLLISKFISKFFNISNLFEQICDHLLDIYKESAFTASSNSYITVEFNT